MIKSRNWSKDMPQIELGGKMVEVSEKDFIWIIQESLKGTETLMHNLCGLLYMWPDVIEKWLPSIQKDYDLVTSLAKQIEDLELQKDMFALEEQIQKIDKLNKQLIVLVSQFLECSPSDTQKKRHKLLRKMNQISEESGPIWAAQPEYRKLYSSVQVVCQNSRELLQEINQRLDQKLTIAQNDN
jgi:hypothetical protein